MTAFQKKFKRMLLALGCGGFLGVALVVQAGDAPGTERQVKALCLFNFVKYAAWPNSAFASTNAAISIGIIGDAELAAALEKAVEGKTVDGRALAVTVISTASEAQQAQLLFIGDKESRRRAEILGWVKSRPVLTVGEGEPFLASGGAIAFVVKNSKVRFEVDLGALAEAQVQLSSKVLSLADDVHGKTP